MNTDFKTVQTVLGFQSPFVAAGASDPGHYSSWLRRVGSDIANTQPRAPSITVIQPRTPSIAITQQVGSDIANTKHCKYTAPSIVITHNSVIQVSRIHSHIHQASQLYPLRCTSVRGARARCCKWTLSMHLHAILPPEVGILLGLQDC